MVERIKSEKPLDLPPEIAELELSSEKCACLTDEKLKKCVAVITKKTDAALSKMFRTLAVRSSDLEVMLACSLKTQERLITKVGKEQIELSKKLQDQVGQWEESMLYIYHNIKKNQWLYANYPDEWVKNYQDIKKGLKAENQDSPKIERIC